MKGNESRGKLRSLGRNEELFKLKKNPSRYTIEKINKTKTWLIKSVKKDDKALVRIKYMW